MMMNKMMNKLSIGALCLLALGACSDRNDRLPETDGTPDTENGAVAEGEKVAVTFRTPLPASAQVTLTPEVHIFRKNGNDFLYEQTIREGWSEGKATARLAPDVYKFLFAASYGNNTRLTPGQLTAAVRFDEVVFLNRKDDDGTLLPADELYLQYPDGEGTTACSVQADDTVNCLMKRAAAKLQVRIEHYERQNGTATLIPYTAATYPLKNDLASIDVTFTGAGEGYTPAGGYGYGTTRFALNPALAVFSDDGAATIDGPFLFPPAPGSGQQAVRFDLRLATGTTLPGETLACEITEGVALKRNYLLRLTLRIYTDSTPPDIPDVPDTPDVPDIPDVPDVPDVPDIPDVPDEPDVPVDIRIQADIIPITAETAGDEGMWY